MHAYATAYDATTGNTDGQLIATRPSSTLLTVLLPMSDEQALHDDCAQHDCSLPTSRRRFLRDSFLSVAGALVAVGMNEPTAAFAMPLEFTEPPRIGSMHSYTIPPRPTVRRSTRTTT